MEKCIAFDMDGTIADFYGVKDWLTLLSKYDTTPYEVAEPLVNMNVLAHLLNKLQKKGYKIQVISWVSKTSTDEYAKRIEKAKKKWLKKHLGSVKWDSIDIIKYGEEKSNYKLFKDTILFDDNMEIRESWRTNGGGAFNERNIIEILKSL